MARSRNIKPGFFTNDQLGECEPLARLLFAGLWTESDREGRLEERQKRLKASLLPYDDCDIDALLRQLHDHQLITRYGINGHRFIQIRQFRKHQDPHYKEPQSEIPSPEQCAADHKPIIDRSLTDDSDSIVVTNPLIPDSGFPHPDSLIRIPDSLQHPSAPKRGAAARLAGFDEFWAAYPKRRKRGEAEKAWVKLKPDASLRARMLKAIDRARASPDWRKEDGRYIPYPATWLNAKGWEDDYGSAGASEQELL